MADRQPHRRPAGGRPVPHRSTRCEGSRRSTPGDDTAMTRLMGYDDMPALGPPIDDAASEVHPEEAAKPPAKPSRANTPASSLPSSSVSGRDSCDGLAASALLVLTETRNTGGIATVSGSGGGTGTAPSSSTGRHAAPPSKPPPPSSCAKCLYRISHNAHVVINPCGHVLCPECDGPRRNEWRRHRDGRGCSERRRRNPHISVSKRLGPSGCGTGGGWEALPAARHRRPRRPDVRRGALHVGQHVFSEQHGARRSPFC